MFFARGVRIVAGAAWLALATAACGGDESPPAATTTTGAGGAGAATASGGAGGAGGLGPTEPVAVHASAGRDEDPSLILAKDGTYLLAWFSERAGSPDLFLSSSPDGATWSQPRAVVGGPTKDFYPSLLQTGDGRFHLAFWRNEPGAAGGVWYTWSDDAETWSDPVALAPSTPFAWAPSLAERAGALVLAYVVDDGTDREIALLQSSDGGAAWEPIAASGLADPAFRDDLPFLVARADGSLLLLSQRYALTATGFEAPFGDPSNELVSATSDDGSAWGAASPVTDDPAAGAVPDVIGSLAPSDDASGWSAVWTSTRAPGAADGDLFAVGLDAAPAADAALLRLTDAPGSDYSARFAPTSIPGLDLVVWVHADSPAEGDLFARFVAR